VNYVLLTDIDKPTAPNYKPILTWQVAEKKVSWGVIFLLGGGFALADACTVGDKDRKYISVIFSDI